MSLKKAISKIEKRTVTIFDDIHVTLKNPTLEVFFDIFMEDEAKICHAGEVLKGLPIDEFLTGALVLFPDLGYRIIVACVVEDDEYNAEQYDVRLDIIRMLPIPEQVKLLNAIYEMNFKSIEHMKNTTMDTFGLFSFVMDLLEKLNIYVSLKNDLLEAPNKP